MDRNGLEMIERTECLRLLRGVAVGRIGVDSEALPAILPVNFRAEDDRILIRTSVGTKLDAAVRGAVVAFEADDFDLFSHSGWSVLVRGVARRVTDAGDLRHLASSPLARWAPSDGHHVVAISTDLVTGRRLVPAAALRTG